jgi:hypothetical protein
MYEMGFGLCSCDASAGKYQSSQERGGHWNGLSCIGYEDHRFIYNMLGHPARPAYAADSPLRCRPEITV